MWEWTSCEPRCCANVCCFGSCLVHFEPACCWVDHGQTPRLQILFAFVLLDLTGTHWIGTCRVTWIFLGAFGWGGVNRIFGQQLLVFGQKGIFCKWQLPSCTDLSSQNVGVQLPQFWLCHQDARAFHNASPPLCFVAETAVH